MKRVEKVGGKEGKKEEFLGTKLKRGILVGRRGGNTTPSPVWRFGLSEKEASELQDLSFPANFGQNISARKLAAELWEIQPQLKFAKLRKGGARLHPHKPMSKGFELPNHFNEAPDSPQDQPATAKNTMKHVTELLQSYQLGETSLHDLQSVSSPGSASAEIIPYRPTIGPDFSLQFKGTLRESSSNVKTSTELLRVFNRIWSLEKQHKSNVTLVNTLNKELDQARTQIKVLSKEKKRYHQEVEDLIKQLAEDKVVREDAERYQILEAVQSLKKDLEDERKLRKHSESLHRKLGRELSEVKSCFSNTFKELEKERQTRVVLEDLCDEFAQGIIDYEQEMRSLKHKSENDLTTVEHADRLILHISEAWLDERVQVKLAEAGSGHANKRTVLDKLSLEIKHFLEAKKYTPLHNKRAFLPKKPARSARSSKESFHLNEAGSAPRDGYDKEDSVDDGFCYAETKRNSRKNSGKQKDHSLPCEYDKNGNANKQAGILLDPSLVTDTASPVERWTSAPDLEASESSSRWPPGVKENTLKAKLLEARLESQQSRPRGP